MSFESFPCPRHEATRPVVTHLALGAVLILTAGLAPVPAMAADAGAAVQVIRDADSGQLRAPTHEEFKALQDKQRAQRKAGAAGEGRRGLVSGKMDPTPQRLSNGARRVELNENSMSYSVVSRQPDGSLAMQCVTGAQAAERALQGTALSKEEAAHDHQ